MSTMMDTDQLEETGHKIRKAVEAVAAIDEQELQEYQSYVNEQQTLRPLLDPTSYRDDNEGEMLAQAERRLNAVQAAREELDDADMGLAELSRQADSGGVELSTAEATQLADMIDRVMTGMEDRDCEDEKEYSILKDVFDKLKEHVTSRRQPQ